MSSSFISSSITSQQLIRRLRSQITLTMDATLRKVTTDIMTMIASVFAEHQTQLMQTLEEVSYLKSKLQEAELKLNENQRENPTAAMETDQPSAPLVPQQLIEEIIVVDEDTPETPELENEVTDEWCVPLGNETVLEENDVLRCVRLRAFSISLPHIPSGEKTEGNSPPALNRTCKKRTRKTSGAVKETPKPESSKKLRKSKESRPNDKRPPDDDQKMTSLPRRGKKKRQKEEPSKTATQKESTTVTSKSAKKKSNLVYPCKVCHEKFNSSSDLRLHSVVHKTCQGCKEVFRFRSGFKMHKPSCEELKKLKAKACQDRNEDVNARTPFDAANDLGWTQPMEDVEHLPNDFLLPVRDLATTLS